MENKSTIQDFIDDITTKDDAGKQLLVLYGQLNQDVIVSAIKLTERKLLMEEVPVSLITKAKIISTEMLQNILKHQTKHDTYLPNFILRLTDDSLNIVSTNVVSELDKEYIMKQINSFSRISHEDFRTFYVESFKDASITSAGDAGLGLLDIFYRSRKKVKYKMEKISTGLFSFHLDVTVSQTLMAAS